MVNVVPFSGSLSTVISPLTCPNNSLFKKARGERAAIHGHIHACMDGSIDQIIHAETPRRLHAFSHIDRTEAALSEWPSYSKRVFPSTIAFVNIGSNGIRPVTAMF